MAVHVPLSSKPVGARLLMMAPTTSSAVQAAIITPTQDITLGCFYLTAEPRTLRRGPKAVETVRLQDRSVLL